MLKQGKQRMIRFETFKLMSFARLSFGARVFWTVLNGFADDDGNVDLDFAGMCRRIDLSVEPTTPEQLEAWYSEFLTSNLVQSYEVGGHKYATIVGWNDPLSPAFQYIRKSCDSNWRNPTPEDSETNHVATGVAEPVTSTERADEGTDIRSASESNQHDGSRSHGGRRIRRPRNTASPEHRELRPSQRTKRVADGGESAEAHQATARPSTRTGNKALQKAPEARKGVGPTPTRPKQIRGRKIDLEAYRIRAKKSAAMSEIPEPVRYAGKKSNYGPYTSPVEVTLAFERSEITREQLAQWLPGSWYLKQEVAVSH